MPTDLSAYWSRLRESLWFIPTVVVVGAIALAVAMVELSAAVDREVLARWPRVFGVGADGSRSMLSAIAGSMITVAGVIFSITMVAVTQASTQYSPRVLRNFMRDRANQWVLGVFVGIFAYCLVVLRTIRAGDESGFVPSLAVLMGVLLAMVGVGFLIFFVHHIATSLQAEEIAARIAHDTGSAMDDLYPDEQAEGSDPEVLPPLVGSESGHVLAPATGYLQRVDIDSLVQLACERDLVVRLLHEPGDFVVAEQPVAVLVCAASHPGSAEGTRTWPELTRAAAARYRVNTYRTLEQDAAFGLRQLVDMAMKALSPGVNDTTTAVTCVEYLGALLVRICNRHMGRAHRDGAGRIRVVAAGPSFERLVELTTDEIRQHARGNVSVLARQLETLGLVAGVTRSPARRTTILHHIELVHEAAVATVPAAHDLAALEARASVARSAATRSSRDAAAGPTIGKER